MPHVYFIACDMKFLIIFLQFLTCFLNVQSPICPAHWLQGPESEELAAASKLEDDINFYQTVNPDVAKLFHVDPQVNRPTLVLLKKEAEKLSHFS